MRITDVYKLESVDPCYSPTPYLAWVTMEPLPLEDEKTILAQLWVSTDGDESIWVEVPSVRIPRPVKP